MPSLSLGGNADLEGRGYIREGMLPRSPKMAVYRGSGEHFPLLENTGQAEMIGGKQCLRYPDLMSCRAL